MPQSTLLLLAIFMLNILFACALPYPAHPQSTTKTLQLAPQIPWENKALGLDFAEISPVDDATDSNKTTLRIVRFDPKYFTFCLHSIGEDKSPPKSLTQWTKEKKLISAINASMYLPDGHTSTGYMRSGSYINNKHRASKFGAYFLAKPKNPAIAAARIVEKDHPKLEQFLAQYSIIIQNYRLISAKRNILWSQGGQKHSIAAVGQDSKGNILFFHVREPIDAHSFASLLLRLPLNIGTVMYVEGGVQAGMVLHHGEENFFWGGRHPAEFFLGNVGVALPNILGVQSKNGSK